MSLPLGEYWSNVKKGDLEMAADGTVYRRTPRGNLVRVTKVPRRVTREQVRERERTAREERVRAAIRSATTKHAERKAKARMEARRRERQVTSRVKRFAVAVAFIAALPWLLWILL